MTRRARIAIGAILFFISIALLLFGFLPLERVRRSQPILPSDMQLPTPASLHFTPIVVS